MPTNTYVALDKVTVTSATPSITFTNISGAYTDLVIVASYTTATAGANLSLYFNADNSSGLYSKLQLEGTGASAITGRSGGSNAIGLESNIGTDTTSPSIQIINVFGYANTSVYKSILAEQSGFMSGALGTSVRAGLWRNFNAITSITLTNGATNISVGSTFSLYGIKAAAVNGTAKATGGTIGYSEGYVYHTFYGSGSFVPSQSLSADILVVAGGGGSGYGQNAGSGGGGGYLEGSGIALTAQTYNVTVGGGGTTSYPSTGDGTAGVNSSFGSIGTAFGGGRGSGNNNLNGGDGGSGGGGGYNGTTRGTGGAATQTSQNGLTGYGNAGAASAAGYAAAAGGGAGGAGNRFTAGPGRASLYMGGVYAASADGGQGPNLTPTVNTGNGGTQGSPGASGIVIIRYAG